MEKRKKSIYPGYIYPREAQEILGLSRTTINSLGDQGMLDFIRVRKSDSSTGHRRFLLDSVKRFKNS